MTPAKPAFSEEYFDLYQRYIEQRHADGDMFPPSRDQFSTFLVRDLPFSRFYEFRLEGRLLAVAVTDLIDGALSAVYTFYDPAESARSLGTLAVLKQLEWAARDGRPHLYLGYWIAGHAKMDYKRRFQPLEGFNGRGWARLQA